MTTPTQVPIPSGLPQDFRFNVEKVDEFVNSMIDFYVDRFGVSRFTIEGIHKAALLAISNIGFIRMGLWEPGVLFDNPAQIINYDGSWFIYKGALPHTTSGAGPEDDGGIYSQANPNGLWADLGDLVLRGDLASENGGDLVNTDVSTVSEVFNAPYVITGRTNIKNPVWNAPRTNAGDPAAAAANAAAINAMLASGNKRVELDDISRYVNQTLIYNSSITVIGAGRSVPSLVWSGGDAPLIARAGYTDPNVMGFSNVRLQDLRITDLAASRGNYYTVDLSNGNSCGLERCWVDGVQGGVLSDKYGVALGKARFSTLSGPFFVAHIRESRLQSAKLLINTTDWYCTENELWGNNRDRAFEITGGGIINACQIVPGTDSGIYLFNDSNFNIGTLKISDTYFDGSTDPLLVTGDGIKSTSVTGLTGSHISGCHFWHLNGRGINISKLYSSTITGNDFTDCDSGDVGLDDIVIGDMYGSHIANTHLRNATAPKTSSTRVNKGSAYNVTGKPGFPLSRVEGQVGFSGYYNMPITNNRELFDGLGGSSLTAQQYATFPAAPSFTGKVVGVLGKPFFSNGSEWLPLSKDSINLPTAVNFDTLTTSGDYYISNMGIHSNTPFSGTDSATMGVRFNSTGFVTQIAVRISTGKVHSREQKSGAWTAWSV